MATAIKSSFNRGEVAPGVHGRVDLEAYQGGLSQAENAIVSVFGGISNRSGLLYICPTGQQTLQPPRYVAFSISAYDTVLVELGHEFMQFIADDRLVTWPSSRLDCTWSSTQEKWEPDSSTIYGSTRALIKQGQLVEIFVFNNEFTFHPLYAYITVDAAFPHRISLEMVSGQSVNPSNLNVAVPHLETLSFRIGYQVATPYLNTEARPDVHNIDYAQDGEVMTIVHPDYAPRELERLEKDSSNWSLAEIDFSPPLATPKFLQATDITPTVTEPIPLGLKLTKETLERTRVQWSAAPGIFSYQIRYREVTGAPAWLTAAGTAFSWTKGSAIEDFEVPEAVGDATITYSIVGLPAGVAFTTHTRIISGTPATTGPGRIVVTAENSEGSATWTANYAIAISLAAPEWADDTGDAFTWTRNQPIQTFIVPYASGTPTPVYTAADLPAGLDFNEVSRQLSGIPTATESGTITVTAQNSEGSDTWTAEYEVQTSTQVPAWNDNMGDAQLWLQNEAITDVFVPLVDEGLPTPSYAAFALPAGIAFNSVTRVLSGTPITPGAGTITINAVNSQGGAIWTLAYVVTSDAVPPSWNESLAPSQLWVRNAQMSYFVPAVDVGVPSPTYGAFDLPEGLEFTFATREISGSPDSVDVGTIRIIAANSEGHASYYIPYEITASSVAPAWDDTTGNALIWTQHQEITALVVPAATGLPAPTYTIADLPSGLLFNAGLRQITGAPTIASLGTITVTATNSQGSATWTVDYEITGSVLPAWNPNVGPEQTWLAGQSIPTLTIPVVSFGTEPITYVAGVLPQGLSFDPETRQLTGTPTSISSGSIRIAATNALGGSVYTIFFSVVASSPVWEDGEGDDVAWDLSSSILPITIPPATGSPPPTYSVVGLPPGISFDTLNLLIAGTPTELGTGTITITATNSAGSDTYTVNFAILSQPQWAYAGNTTFRHVWLPSGHPTPMVPTRFTPAIGAGITYEVSDLPENIVFSPETVELNGTAPGDPNDGNLEGTIIIGASNAQGSSDLSVPWISPDTFYDISPDDPIYSLGYLTFYVNYPNGWAASAISSTFILYSAGMLQGDDDNNPRMYMRYSGSSLGGRWDDFFLGFRTPGLGEIAFAAGAHSTSSDEVITVVGTTSAYAWNVARSEEALDWRTRLLALQIGEQQQTRIIIRRGYNA